MTREEILQAISRALTSGDVRQLNLPARPDQITAAQEQLKFEFLRWPRLFGQIFRFDKWIVCRG
jgi:hypothetical protein